MQKSNVRPERPKEETSFPKDSAEMKPDWDFSNLVDDTGRMSMLARVVVVYSLAVCHNGRTSSKQWNLYHESAEMLPFSPVRPLALSSPVLKTLQGVSTHYDI